MCEFIYWVGKRVEAETCVYACVHVCVGMCVLVTTCVMFN